MTNTIKTTGNIANWMILEIDYLTRKIEKARNAKTRQQFAAKLNNLIAQYNLTSSQVEAYREEMESNRKAFVASLPVIESH